MKRAKHIFWFSPISLFTLPVTFAVASIFGLSALASEDPAAPGPKEVVTGEYKFPAALDHEVLQDVKTELWAKAFWPRHLNRKTPIVFFLHGNHPTCGSGHNPRRNENCGYTQTGKCPSGEVVVPNHEGYSYIAENLASHGYIVVSINANRGITCGSGTNDDGGLIIARGQLVLRHLERWFEWHSRGDAPRQLGVKSDTFLNRIDFENVGLMGHSRGGEGVRAAYNLYLDKKSPWPTRIPDLKVKGIFEIGSVDKMSNRVFDALDTAWTQLLPLCDGDVSDLEGRMPYERMLKAKTETNPSAKSLYMVWGTNHNFFNSEWQDSDAAVCVDHNPIYDRYPEKQRHVGMAAVAGFFRAHVGASRTPNLAEQFDPLFALPKTVSDVTKVDREMTATPAEPLSWHLEEFDRPTGMGSRGILNGASQIEISHENTGDLTRAKLKWTTSGSNVFFQSNWVQDGQGISLLDRSTVDIRVGRERHALNPTLETDFAIQLVHPDGTLSQPVYVSEVSPVRGPVSTVELFQTLRIPLSAFADRQLEKIQGLRVTFDRTPTGALILGQIRLSSLFQSNGSAFGVQPLAQWKSQTNIPSDREDIGYHSQQASLENRLRVSSRLNNPLNTQIIEQSKERIKQGINEPSPSKIPQAIERSARVLAIRQVNSARQLAGSSAIEIIIATEEHFPVRDDQPILKIGDKDFSISRFPQSGRTDRLIFSIPSEEFATVQNDSSMHIQYGKRSTLIYRLPKLDSTQLQGSLDNSYDDHHAEE